MYVTQPNTILQGILLPDKQKHETRRSNELQFPSDLTLKLHCYLARTQVNNQLYKASEDYID